MNKLDKEEASNILKTLKSLEEKLDAISKELDDARSTTILPDFEELQQNDETAKAGYLIEDIETALANLDHELSEAFNKSSFLRQLLKKIWQPLANQYNYQSMKKTNTRPFSWTRSEMSNQNAAVNHICEIAGEHEIETFICGGEQFADRIEGAGLKAKDFTVEDFEKWKELVVKKVLPELIEAERLAFVQIIANKKKK